MPLSTFLVMKRVHRIMTVVSRGTVGRSLVARIFMRGGAKSSRTWCVLQGVSDAAQSVGISSQFATGTEGLGLGNDEMVDNVG
jgi:hypothetical protein